MTPFHATLATGAERSCEPDTRRSRTDNRRFTDGVSTPPRWLGAQAGPHTGRATFAARSVPPGDRSAHRSRRPTTDSPPSGGPTPFGPKSYRLMLDLLSVGTPPPRHSATPVHVPLSK